MNLTDEYRVACTALRKKGVHEKKVDFCPVEYDKKGSLVFRVREKYGETIRWASVPIAFAKQDPESLVGFIYPDGTMRSDAEMLCSIRGGVDIPMFVAFWRVGVPRAERVFRSEILR